MPLNVFLEFKIPKQLNMFWIFPLIFFSGKIFINVCSDPNISDASPRSDVKPDNKGRIAWAIPYSTSKPRRDLDKAGQNCMVYDVIFNPNVIKETQSNYNFRDMVNSTALEGVEKAFKLKLDRKRLRFPRLQFKGAYDLLIF